MLVDLDTAIFLGVSRSGPTGHWRVLEGSRGCEGAMRRGISTSRATGVARALRKNLKPRGPPKPCWLALWSRFILSLLVSDGACLQLILGGISALRVWEQNHAWKLPVAGSRSTRGGARCSTLLSFSTYRGAGSLGQSLSPGSGRDSRFQ